MAGFAEADSYVLPGIEEALSGGVDNNGKPRNVEIVLTDSQSNLNRASEVAADLILGEELDIIVAASTTDTVNQVSADQAEIKEVPCITTDCPWQPYFLGRNGVPGEGFASTHYFFWGLEEVIGAFLDMWDNCGVAKTVGGLFQTTRMAMPAANRNLGCPNRWPGQVTIWLIQAGTGPCRMISRTTPPPSRGQVARSTPAT